MSLFGNIGSSLKTGFGAVNAGSFKNPLEGITGGMASIKAGVSGTPSKPGTTASDTYAALTQEQWQNYVNTFVPIENQLINYATDKTQPQQAMAAAQTDVSNAYGVQAGSQARQLAGEGVTLSQPQQQEATRQTGLSAALAGVQAQNVARDLTINRQQGILGNPAPSVSSIAQQASGLGV